MGTGWKDMEMPKKLECDESTYTDTYGKFALPMKKDIRWDNFSM